MQWNVKMSASSLLVESMYEYNIDDKCCQTIKKT